MNFIVFDDERIPRMEMDMQASVGFTFKQSNNFEDAPSKPKTGSFGIYDIDRKQDQERNLNCLELILVALKQDIYSVIMIAIKDDVFAKRINRYLSSKEEFAERFLLKKLIRTLSQIYKSEFKYFDKNRVEKKYSNEQLEE